MTTPQDRAAFEPREELLTQATDCGAVITGKPDGSEAVTVVFSTPAWRAFDVALQLQAAALLKVGDLRPDVKDPSSTWPFVTQAMVDAQAAPAKELTEQAEPVGTFRLYEGCYEHMADFYEGDDAVKLYAAPVAQQGWKLVPVEPTKEMIQACTDCWIGEGHPEDVYKTMISAAPEA